MDVCKAWEDMKVKTTKETQEETLLQDLRSLMETLHLSTEQAMAALKVPETKRSRLIARL